MKMTVERDKRTMPKFCYTIVPLDGKCVESRQYYLANNSQIMAEKQVKKEIESEKNYPCNFQLWLKMYSMTKKCYVPIVLFQVYNVKNGIEYFRFED